MAEEWATDVAALIDAHPMGALQIRTHVLCGGLPRWRRPKSSRLLDQRAGIVPRYRQPPEPDVSAARDP
jgi:hypothetical protein